jgi:hypothetical protein
MSAAPLRHLPLTGFAPPGTRVVFCGHCGRPPQDGQIPEVGARVCTRCNLGLLLDAPRLVAPRPNDAFLVVDRSLAVCALSRRAEKFLSAREVDAVDRHVTELLVPADAEAQGPNDLSALLVAAASGAEGDEPAHAVLRPADEFGVRFSARIGPCGPTPGALVVLELG